MKTFLIAAISADGFIARTNDQPADWTSTEDKKIFVALTKEAGVMVMGATTYRTIGRALPGRKTIVYSHQPIDNSDIETTQEAPRQLVERLAASGANGLAICGGAQIYSLFADVIDEVYLTVEPIFFGSGVPLFSGALDLSLELVESRSLNNNVLLLHYRVVR